MSRFTKKLRHGFTLVEIMIVVLIIGILLAIAVPNFVKARESSRTKSCIANMKQIESAEEQYMMDNKTSTPQTTIASLSPDYLKSEPECPSGGTYTVTDGGDGTYTVDCDTAGHDLPTASTGT